MKTLVNHYFEEEKEEEETVKDTQGPKSGQTQASTTPLRTVPKAWDNDMPPYNPDPTVEPLLGLKVSSVARGVTLCDRYCGDSNEVTCYHPTASGLGGPNSP